MMWWRSDCMCVCVCVSYGALYGSKQSNEACVRARAVGPHTLSSTDNYTCSLSRSLISLFLFLIKQSFITWIIVVVINLLVAINTLLDPNVYCSYSQSLYSFGLNWCYSIFDLDETVKYSKSVWTTRVVQSASVCSLKQGTLWFVFGDDCIGQRVLRALLWFYASFRITQNNESLIQTQRKMLSLCGCYFRAQKT